MSEDETKQEDTQVIKMPTPAELEGGEDDDEEGEDDDDGVVVYSIGLRHSAPVIAFDPRQPIDLLPAFGLARKAVITGGDPFFVFEGDPDEGGIGAAVVSIPDVVAIGVVVSEFELQEYLAPDPEDGEDEEEDEPETAVERVQREAAERRERKKAEKIARQQVEAQAGKKNKKGLKGIV